MIEYRPTENFNDVIYGSHFRNSDNSKYYQRVYGEVKIADGANLDSFGRLRVSLPHTLFDATLYTGISSMSFDTSTANGGTATHDSNKKAAILTATTTVNSQAILQTRQYLKYSPAKSILVVMTGNLKGGATNVIKRLGQFDYNNGFFFELSSSTFSVGLRSKITGSIVDTKVSQSSFNLDVLDGSGSASNPSGILLDLSLQQIFMITYQHLGSGRVIFALNIGGQIIPVHQFLNSNVNTAMYSQTATLPIRYEITNTGATTSTMEVTCMALLTENSGGSELIGTPYSVSNLTTAVTIAGGIGVNPNVPVVAIRKKASAVEIPLRIYEAFHYMNSSDQALIQLVFNPTISGGAWVAAPSGNAEINITGTTTTGTGVVVHSHYVDGSSGNSILDIEAAFNDTALFTLGQSIAGVSDILAIVVNNLSTGTTNYAGFNYKELVI